MNNLFVQAIGKFLLGVIIIGLLLFLPAGSLQYWQGWAVTIHLVEQIYKCTWRNGLYLAL